MDLFDEFLDLIKRSWEHRPSKNVWKPILDRILDDKSIDLPIKSYIVGQMIHNKLDEMIVYFLDHSSDSQKILDLQER